MTLCVGLDRNVSFKAGSPYQARITPECKEVSEHQHISDKLLGYANQEAISIPCTGLISTGRDQSRPFYGHYTFRTRALTAWTM